MEHIFRKRQQDAAQRDVIQTGHQVVSSIIQDSRLHCGEEDAFRSLASSPHGLKHLAVVVLEKKFWNPRSISVAEFLRKTRI